MPTRMIVRMGLGAVLILAVALATHLAGGVGKAPDVEMPEIDFRAMPMTLGPWVGESIEVDPEIVGATGAEIVDDRRYVNLQSRGSVAIHGAVFKDPEEGVLHTVTNCYRGQGWVRISQRELLLEVEGARTVPVSLYVWERDGERANVLSWYEWGEHHPTGRWSMGWLRFKMRNEQPWPAMVKVLMQTSIDGTGPDAEEEARTRILGLARLVSRWMEDHMRQPPASEAP